MPIVNMPVNFERKFCQINNFKSPVRFIDSLRPTYLICRIFGMLPFKILQTSTGDIEGQRVDWIDLIWFIILDGIFVSFGLSSFGVFDSDKLFDKESLLEFVDNINFLSDINLMIFTTIFDMFNRYRFVKILKQFIEFDKKV